MNMVIKHLPIVLLAVVLSSCNGGSNDPTLAVDPSLESYPILNSLTPRIGEIVLDEDPDSPVAFSIIFGPDDLTTHIDYVGSKVDGGRQADFALVHVRGLDEAIRVEIGTNNLPVSAVIPELGELRFDHSSGSMHVELVEAGGTISIITKQPVIKLAPVTHLRARPPPPDYSVKVTRGTRLDVSLEGPLTLPSGLAPFVRKADCTRDPNISCSYWLVPNGHTWSMGILHSAFTEAGAEGAPQPDWPDIESCESARVGLALTFGGGIAATTVAPVLAERAAIALNGWLVNTLNLVAADVAVVGAVPTAAAAITAGVVAVAFYNIGLNIGEFINGEIDCATVISRAGIQTGLLAGINSLVYTVDVCFPEVSEFTFMPRCQSVGPYRPFNGDVELGSLIFTATAASSFTSVSAFLSDVFVHYDNPVFPDEYKNFQTNDAYAGIFIDPVFTGTYSQTAEFHSRSGNIWISFEEDAVSSLVLDEHLDTVFGPSDYTVDTSLIFSNIPRVTPGVYQLDGLSVCDHIDNLEYILINRKDAAFSFSLNGYECSTESSIGVTIHP